MQALDSHFYTDRKESTFVNKFSKILGKACQNYYFLLSNALHVPNTLCGPHKKCLTENENKLMRSMLKSQLFNCNAENVLT